MSEKLPRRRSLSLLALIALLFLLASCAGGMPIPTATAIPLAATATPSPRPLWPTPTAANRPPSSPAPLPLTPTPFGPAGLSDLDDRLAERAAQDFVARLARGETAGAFRLYLTDQARAGEPGQLLSRFAATESSLLDATLLEFRRATAASYEARLLLRWAGAASSAPATQTMTLRLVYQRGLWLIDGITLGDLQAAAPTPTARSSTGPRLAPLAGRLVFQASSGGDIYLINADGSGLRRLTDGLDPAWSPDGTQIAFTRWRNPWGVYLVNPDGSGERRVVDGIRLKEVAWSPDASQVAITINYSSSEPIEICFFGFCFTIPPFSFGQLWTANLQTGEFLSLPLDDKAVHAPTWSPTGDRIVYAGERGLAWINLPGMEKGRFAAGSVWDTSPSFSPDGRQIAFMGRVHDRWEIFLMNADGSGRRQITQSDPQLADPPSNVAPAWSPDGKQIAFLSNRDGPWRIYVMNIQDVLQGDDRSAPRSLFGDKLDRLGLRYEWATERVISWSR